MAQNISKEWATAKRRCIATWSLLLFIKIKWVALDFQLTLLFTFDILITVSLKCYNKYESKHDYVISKRLLELFYSFIGHPVWISFIRSEHSLLSNLSFSKKVNGWMGGFVNNWMTYSVILKDESFMNFGWVEQNDKQWMFPLFHIPEFTAWLAVISSHFIRKDGEIAALAAWPLQALYHGVSCLCSCS
jgi:hypothetical protein